MSHPVQLQRKCHIRRVVVAWILGVTVLIGGSAGCSDDDTSTGPTNADAPTIRFVTPVEGTELGGTVELRVSTSRAQSVTYYANAVQIGRSTTSPFNVLWDTRTWPNGAYTLSATAVGNGDASHSIGVSIVNTGGRPGDEKADGEL